jgi:hypothetical protein
MVLTVYLNFLWNPYFSKLIPLVFEIDECFFYKKSIKILDALLSPFFDHNSSGNKL